MSVGSQKDGSEGRLLLLLTPDNHSLCIAHTCSRLSSKLTGEAPEHTHGLEQFAQGCRFTDSTRPIPKLGTRIPSTLCCAKEMGSRTPIKLGSISKRARRASICCKHPEATYISEGGAKDCAVLLWKADA